MTQTKANERERGFGRKQRGELAAEATVESLIRNIDESSTANMVRLLREEAENEASAIYQQPRGRAHYKRSPAKPYRPGSIAHINYCGIDLHRKVELICTPKEGVVGPAFRLDVYGYTFLDIMADMNIVRAIFERRGIKSSWYIIWPAKELQDRWETHLEEQVKSS